MRRYALGALLLASCGGDPANRPPPTAVDGEWSFRVLPPAPYPYGRRSDPECLRGLLSLGSRGTDPDGSLLGGWFTCDEPSGHGEVDGRIGPDGAFELTLRADFATFGPFQGVAAPDVVESSDGTFRAWPFAAGVGALEIVPVVEGTGVPDPAEACGRIGGEGFEILLDGHGPFPPPSHGVHTAVLQGIDPGPHVVTVRCGACPEVVGFGCDPTLTFCGPREEARALVSEEVDVQALAGVRTTIEVPFAAPIARGSLTVNWELLTCGPLSIAVEGASCKHVWTGCAEGTATIPNLLAGSYIVKLGGGDVCLLDLNGALRECSGGASATVGAGPTVVTAGLACSGC